MSNNSFVWWNQVSGPSMFMKKILNTLGEEKSCALFFPENIPWYDVFSDMIKDKLRMMNSENDMEIINISELQCKCADDAGKFIAEKYCPQDKIIDRWPGESYAEFLANNDDTDLNNKYIWIKGISEDNFVMWYDFICKYAEFCGSGKKRAAFLLECLFDYPAEKNKYVKVLNWNEEVHKYDYYMFCSVLVSELQCSDGFKHYISELAYNLSEFHAEFAANLLEYGIKLAESPERVLEKCMQNFVYPGGEKIKLENCFNIDSVILEVQVKNIFPAIERYRRNFVTKYYDDVKSFLPISNAMDEDITDPYGCEINILRKMTDKRIIRASAEDAKFIRLMHDARNFVAHNHPLEYKKLAELLICDM